MRAVCLLMAQRLQQFALFAKCPVYILTKLWYNSATILKLCRFGE